MNFLQRIAIAALVVIGSALAAPGIAQAQQKFPVKPVRLVVAFTPGGTTDILARMVAPGMSETFGQPLVIESRPGAGGVLAASLVAKAPADGYTLLATSAALLISAVLSDNAQYNPLKDFASVAELGYSTTVLVVTPSLGVRTVKELAALANSKPVKLLFGSTGAGTSTHLSAERFRIAAGFKAQHVGFKGQSEFLIEIIAGRIHFGTSGLIVSLPFIKDGKLVALVVATPQRSPVLPDIPAAPEVLPGWGRDGSQAWLAPAGTPRAVRQQISRELARQLAQPEIRERLQNMGFTVASTTPEEHEKNLRADLVVFTRLVTEVGLKAK
ncbi:MAG TPA: tripartite tricarboxylate transporter substrate binding protein [Burkholderiales bacterium]|jgi:tripartite-type tricarboxylate transporter receptor subunit TctC|nr:tripartite tricarboxylate transporter substrate binding protein [Burkholderiales bacterium]